MNLFRWALSVFVIVMPLYGVFSGAQDTEQDGAQQARSCHDFIGTKQIIDRIWPDLHFRSGLTLTEPGGITLSFYNQGGRVYVVGQNFVGLQQTSYPCVQSVEDVYITMSSPDGKYIVARKGNQFDAAEVNSAGQVVQGSEHVFSVGAGR